MLCVKYIHPIFKVKASWMYDRKQASWMYDQNLLIKAQKVLTILTTLECFTQIFHWPIMLNLINKHETE